MERIVSRDGTPIAYHRRGAGPPLVLVHGAGAANPIAWTVALPVLEERLTVYAIDRRGRGESGDGATYAIEREFEDVAAVVDAIGQPASVLGHSFGGICALEASLLTRNIEKLVLYEPGVPQPGIPGVPDGIIERLQSLLDAGDREATWTTFMLEIAGLSPDEVSQFKSSPLWPARLASTHTLVREIRALEDYAFDPERFNARHVPTLLLLGGESSDAEKAATEALDRILPDSRIALLPGQEHVAMYTAPRLFAREVLAFLLGPDRRTAPQKGR